MESSPQYHSDDRSILPAPLCRAFSSCGVSPPATPSPPLMSPGVGSNLVTQMMSNCVGDDPLFVDIGPDSSKMYTRNEFWHLVGQYAAALTKMGIGKGDRVAAQVSKRIENVALYLGTVQIGGIYLPMNTDYTQGELQYFVQDAQPSIYVHQKAANLPELNENECRSLPEEDMLCCAQKEECELHVEPVHENDVAAILYTSGTTGKPKGAMISHGNLLSNARTLCRVWQMARSDVMLHCLPIFHVHGLFVAINPLLLVGAKFLFLPRFETETVVRRLAESTVMMGVPTYYTRLMQSSNLTKLSTKNMRLFTSGSAPLLECTWNKFRDVTGGHEILERYGMTEGQMVCSNPFEGPRKPTTVGPPLPSIQARVRSGMLEYRGPNVFRGYWNKPEKTAAEFTEDGFFKSGDLAHIDEDGYVHILGRGKDLIISGGLNVYPKEVENVLDRLRGIKESAVIGVPDPDFGEAVVAVVVVYSPKAPPLTSQQIIGECRTSLAGYKVPKQVHQIESLPRNTMGKVQKNKIREMLLKEQPLSCGYNVIYDQ